PEACRPEGSVGEVAAQDEHAAIAGASGVRDEQAMMIDDRRRKSAGERPASQHEGEKIMKPCCRMFIVCLLAIFALGTAWSQDEPYPNVPWTDLFSGLGFEGWALAKGNGKAEFKAKNGMIVGTTVVDTPNSFLKSDRMYGDFVLEYEFKVDEGLNSGVQVRSHNFPAYKDNRVHGYQVEIDPSERGSTAGVYDEARRAVFIYDPKDDPQKHAAFKHNDWNKVLVIFVGDRVQTCLNGVAITDVKDLMTPAGYLYLQVHKIYKPEFAGMKVAWRNMRIKDLDRAGRTPGIQGPWKGATSDASNGIYANVEKVDDEVVAKIYDTPEMQGAPLAELMGKAEKGVTKLSGDEWSGQIGHGVFAGKGKVKAIKVGLNGARNKMTDQDIEVNFEMIKGAILPTTQ
ncbi:MAG: DUF1080 domain-containing protein, partial [Opitutaceae bacterium]|nr:DUF1080 domain-containing protein [Opitutaceae bacterium]